MGPGRQDGQISDEELKQMKGGAEAPDASGITTVKEYQYVAASKLPEVKGISSYKPMADRTVRFAINVWAGLGPDHLRQQRLQARQGVEDAGRERLQGRARAHRRSGGDARCLRGRQSSRRLGDARHAALVPRGTAEGLPRHAARVPAGRLVERRRRDRRPRTRSRPWPTCAGRRSSSRRTRRRTISC